MADSPPPSPSLSIEVDTPPDSPSQRYIVVELTPPAKRSQTGSTYIDPTPTKRKKQLTGPTTRTVQPSGALVTDQQHPASLELPDGPTNVVSTDSDLIESDENDGYLHYVDLVLAEGIAFYQISSTIFVVQGWDPRSTSGTVCSFSSTAATSF